MRTTIDVPDKILADVRKATGENGLNKAVNKALAEYVRREKLKGLRELIGKVSLTDNWRELEELELAEAARLRDE